MSIKLRKLTKKDVEFELKIEPEDESPEGHFASDDEEADAQMVQEIIERSNSGFVEAWCVLIVTATWNEYEGRDVLGGVSFLPPNDKQSDIEELVKEHGMYENALDDLNNTLEQAAKDLSKLER